MIGKTICGRYYIIKHLRDGMFAQTYEAEDTHLPNRDKCIVKHFKPQTNDEFTLNKARGLFEAEAQAMNKLGKHDRIPTLFDLPVENGEFYLVRDFIEGYPLSQELTPESEWSETEVIDLLEEILEILEFVHKNGVIHRDINPSNIIRRESDRKLVLIIDFGAVKQITNQLFKTGEEGNKTVAIGTKGYMPLEQLEGNPEFCSDIYAVGMIGIQALTGTSPLQLRKHPKTNEVIWRNRIKVSRRLAEVLDIMVKYQPKHRYQTATEALKAVKSLRRSIIPGVPPLAFSVRDLINWLLVLLPILAAWFAVPGFEEWFFGLFSNEKIEFLTYEDNGIKMKYPKNWARQDIENPATASKVTFLSPLENSADKFQEEVNVSIEDLPEPMKLEEYNKSALKEIKDFLPDAKIDDASATTLANRPGYEVVFTGKDGSLILKRRQVWVLKNNQAYIITYTAEEGKYENFLKTAKAMIDSVEIQ